MSNTRDDARGDAVYDAWLNGLNPDEVDYARVDEDYREGHDRFECAEREVVRQRKDRAILREHREAGDGGE